MDIIDIMDIKLAIKILEITNIDNLNESDFKSLRRRAQKRWHPDTISHTDPDQETLQRYQYHFSLIDKAIELVKNLINGNVHVGEATKKQYKHAVNEEPEDVIRRNAAELQCELKKIWEGVKEQRYKLKEEVVILSPGDSYKTLLAFDLKDEIPLLCIASLFFGVFLYAFLMIFSMILLSTVPLLLSLVTVFLTGLWFVQALACFIGFLPLSRFWFPQKMGDIILYLINVGLKFYSLIHELGLTRSRYLALLFGVPIQLAKLTQWVIVSPIYLLVSMVIGNRIFGRVEKKSKYYAGFADWYIEELIRGDFNRFSKDDLFSLSRAYAELKEMV